ncbi:hypothetical protein RRG08_042231 [Elysia crispata]|uniref:Uncharacterized protein n=1 Tax=Elysia crispata TaxID=231223 RepID=A0AAE1E579_9GAST|nr:hypothetical protein RRG08_042231 [Elysia crispata]
MEKVGKVISWPCSVRLGYLVAVLCEVRLSRGVGLVSREERTAADRKDPSVRRSVADSYRSTARTVLTEVSKDLRMILKDSTLRQAVLMDESEERLTVTCEALGSLPGCDIVEFGFVDTQSVTSARVAGGVTRAGRVEAAKDPILSTAQPWRAGTSSCLIHYFLRFASSAHGRKYGTAEKVQHIMYSLSGQSYDLTNLDSQFSGRKSQINHIMRTGRHSHDVGFPSWL